MPPKKAEQQPINPSKPFYVLPLFLNDSPEQSDAQKIFRSKPINIKKCIDKTKIIEILKDKGLAQHLSPQGEIRPQGRKFICQNFKTVLQQSNTQLSKPVDSKGLPQKKKDAKKQQVPVEQNKEPTVQLTMDKKCDYFHFLLDIPQNPDQLRACIQNGLRIDAVLIIEQKTKKGSNPPNYDLLGKAYQQNDLLSSLNTTKVKEAPRMQKALQHQHFSKTKIVKQMIKQIRKIKNENHEFSNLIIAQVPYEKDISHPENNEMNFINTAFTKLCSTTLQKEKYENWLKSNVKKVPMIEPLKEVIKKQVPIENQDKKGKKDVNKQPEFETVQEIIETKYESHPQNIRSDLKIYKQLSSVRTKQKYKNNTLQSLIENALSSVDLQIGKNFRPVHINPEILIQNLTSKPLAKLNFMNSLKHNLREVQSFSKSSLIYNLIHQSEQVQKNVNLTEIIHRDPSKKQILEFQFIMKAFTDFMQSQQPRLRWNFSDRMYRQKLTKNQVLSQIQNQLFRDPKIYEGILKQDNLKLLCMAKINPPGRMLYSNDIFKQKTVSDFQNWSKSFSSNSLTEANEFYDYKFQDAGNLSIRREKLIPTDNVVICDQKITIGNEIIKINHFQKYNTLYGVKQTNTQSNEFWISNKKDKIKLNIFQKEHQFKKTATVSQKVKQEGSEEQKIVQKIIETTQNHKRVEMYFKTQNFILSHTPYPTIFWINDTNSKFRSGQARRQFGPKGEITSYLNDGSVRIFYLNGNVSTFRNNRWEKVINNELQNSTHPPKKLTLKQFSQGDKIIKIREDQTIFVQYANGHQLIIFSDGTKVLYKKKENSFQIKTYYPEVKEEIIVRLILPKNKQQSNVVGHGSAFAYLGFKNLLQRSVDGFLYEVWHNQFTTHLYNEKYEYENKTYEQEIRLIYLQDGSLIKVQANDHITFIQGDYELTEEKLKEKWNQAFTLEENHEVGVYDIHLTEGTIRTKDAESNSFKINVNEENEINIAVSFKISDEDKITNNFGTGFHVPEENYFLPVPENCLPARLFSFDNQTHSYYEYLTESQIRQMEVSSGIAHIEEFYLENKTVKQYTRQVRQKGKFQEDKKVVTFSQVPTEREYEIPGILIPKETRVNMAIENDTIQFKVVEKIEWNKQFQNVTRIQQEIQRLKQLRGKELKIEV